MTPDTPELALARRELDAAMAQAVVAGAACGLAETAVDAAAEKVKRLEAEAAKPLSQRLAEAFAEQSEFHADGVRFHCATATDGIHDSFTLSGATDKTAPALRREVQHLIETAIAADREAFAKTCDRCEAQWDGNATEYARGTRVAFHDMARHLRDGNVAAASPAAAPEPAGAEVETPEAVAERMFTVDSNIVRFCWHDDPGLWMPCGPNKDDPDDDQPAVTFFRDYLIELLRDRDAWHARNLQRAVAAETDACAKVAANFAAYTGVGREFDTQTDDATGQYARGNLNAKTSIAASIRARKAQQ